MKYFSNGSNIYFGKSKNSRIIEVSVKGKKYKKKEKSSFVKSLVFHFISKWY